MLIEAGIACFGLVIGRRIFLYLDQNQILDSKTSQLGWKIFILMQLLIMIAFHKNNLAHWCLNLGTFLTPLLYYIYQNRTRQAQFRRHLVPLLDYLILQMRSGRSLREALTTGRECFHDIQYHLIEMISLLHFEAEGPTQNKDELFVRVSFELLEIQQKPYKMMERLKAFRNLIKTEQDFRRKTNQVSLQIRLQASILLLLYLGLLGYVISSREWKSIETFVLFSVVLFSGGLLALFSLPRTFRWKT